MRPTKDPNDIEQTIEDLRDYVELRFEKTKLHLLEGMVHFSNNVLNFFILMLGGALSVLFLAAGITFLLSEAIGSMTWALFIMFGAFLTISVILFIFRKRLFTGPLVRMFVKLLYEPKKDDEDE